MTKRKRQLGDLATRVCRTLTLRISTHFANQPAGKPSSDVPLPSHDPFP
jgi:hypothetical protein